MCVPHPGHSAAAAGLVPDARITSARSPHPHSDRPPAAMSLTWSSAWSSAGSSADSTTAAHLPPRRSLTEAAVVQAPGGP